MLPTEVRKALESLPNDPELLLSEEQRERLNTDLAAIHRTMYPCWEPR